MLPGSACALSRAALRAALDDFEWQMRYELPEIIAAATADDPGRGQVSMTAWDPTERTPTVLVRQRAHRGRRRP
ncbi:MAG: hypothetical protein QJR12_09630 [Mycobacterium sp.]|uniref:hypothetical protein n=1 Tax=Mycobacterium sp. TaxID=1785 RepID=UPI002614EEE8|nr:hypothetical protein [Mycobacterium sp.]MDI3314517.1 hypothetical protein [Mycobacterium sp.]